MSSYYPQGGGQCEVTIEPCKTLKPVSQISMCVSRLLPASLLFFFFSGLAHTCLHETFFTVALDGKWPPDKDRSGRFRDCG